MSEWTSVNDMTPNECVPVIAVNGRGELIVCTFYDGKFVQDTSVAEAYGGCPLEPLERFDVAHWMSLPGQPDAQ